MSKKGLATIAVQHPDLALFDFRTHRVLLMPQGSKSLASHETVKGHKENMGVLKSLAKLMK